MHIKYFDEQIPIVQVPKVDSDDKPILCRTASATFLGFGQIILLLTTVQLASEQVMQQHPPCIRDGGVHTRHTHVRAEGIVVQKAFRFLPMCQLVHQRVQEPMVSLFTMLVHSLIQPRRNGDSRLDRFGRPVCVLAERHRRKRPHG